MAKIRPFCAVRPSRDKVHLVASRPVYTYSRRILNAKLETNPYTFIHIIQPEFRQPREQRTSPNSRKRFQKVRNMYERFLEDGWFFRDEKPSIYIYRQIKDNRSYVGLIAGISNEDYFGGVIKKHEQTLTKRENMFKEYLDEVNFNAEPVLLTYPDSPEIEVILHRYIQDRPEYNFTNTDHIQHQLWCITDESDIQAIQHQFEGFDSIYIADGHHRSASSALLGKARTEAGQGDGDAQHNYFMSFFIPESQLDIYDFNRVVKDLNGLSCEAFLEALEEKFEVVEIEEELHAPKQLHHFSMYLDGRWFELRCKPGTYIPGDPVGTLDSQILTANILSPILGIHDLKTNKRIDFVGGLKGMEALKHAVDCGKMKVAFGLFPVSVEQLKNIADTGNIMPPKTTWIEPKLRSGLTIFEL